MSFSSDNASLVNQLPTTLDIPKDEKRFREFLSNHLKDISNAVNSKEGGLFNLNEQVNSHQYFSIDNPQKLRNVYRKTINFGVLPNTSSKSVAHGISVTNLMSFTHIYATASNQTSMNFIPIPYSSPTAANNIEISVDQTNVTITTGSNRSAFNICYVVLEYLKN